MAARQHGVVSIRQLRGPLGHTEREVERATESRRLHRIFTGVYAVGHKNLSQHGWCLAAVLACGPHSVLSHFSAAWLWGITRNGPAPYEVTTPIPRRRKPPRIVVHRARHLLDADRYLIEGIPITAVPRTLLDLAARSHPERLRRHLERGEELGLLDLGPIAELLERTRGHHGHARLRRAAALYAPAPFTRSQLERSFLDAILAAGLPRPSVNSFVAGYELDMYWPEYRLAVELDAFETHGSREAFERDRVRQEELLLAGIETVRITGARFDREPDAVIERVDRLLNAKGRA